MGLIGIGVPYSSDGYVAGNKRVFVVRLPAAAKGETG